MDWVRLGIRRPCAPVPVGRFLSSASFFPLARGAFFLPSPSKDCIQSAVIEFAQFVSQHWASIMAVLTLLGGIVAAAINWTPTLLSIYEKSLAVKLKCMEKEVRAATKAPELLPDERIIPRSRRLRASVSLSKADYHALASQVELLTKECENLRRRLEEGQLPRIDEDLEALKALRSMYVESVGADPDQYWRAVERTRTLSLLLLFAILATLPHYLSGNSPWSIFGGTWPISSMTLMAAVIPIGFLVPNFVRACLSWFIRSYARL